MLLGIIYVRLTLCRTSGGRLCGQTAKGQIVKVKRMIPYEKAAKIVDKTGETIGGLGGYFREGMRWKDHLERFTKEGREYAEAFRKYVLKNEIRHGGDWHQEEEVNGAPLFSDGKAATFSYRAWGDIMAAIWSEKDNIDYSYMDFYMDCTMRT